MSIFAQVRPHTELDRMFSLPARQQPDLSSAEALALAAEVTRLLARTTNPWPGVLYPIQALALKELYDSRGLMGLIRVGGGKTLLSALAFTVLRAERPMLILPSSMVVDCKKTWARLAEHWHIPPLSSVTVLAYEKISAPAAGARTLPDGTTCYPDLVTRHSPDVIVADECHKLGTMSAAGTRRVGRYLHEHPSTIFVGLSGTAIRRSFKDAAHLMEWALHENSPLPREWEPLEQLADATDARTSSGLRTDPGVLLDHLTPAESQAYYGAESPEDARAEVTGMVGRRILQTAGVISSSDGPLGIPARLDPVFPEDEDPAIEEEIRLLIKGDEASGRLPGSLPEGTLLPDAMALARPLTTLPLGFYLIQDPPPPDAYRAAASAWASEVRTVIKYGSTQLDSEWQVKDAVRRGVLPEMSELLAEWEAQRAAYREATGLREPPSVPRWISDETIRAVEAWLSKGAGLVWVSYVALGQRLAKDLGIEYFGGGKLDSKGRHVTDLRRGEPAILSHASVGVGTNGLQEHMSRCLYLCAPTEQSLGRLHRPGQLADVVLNDVYLGGAQHLRRYWRAVDLAKNFASRIAGPQKYDYFQSTVPQEVDRGGYRWSNAASGDSGEDA